MCCQCEGEGHYDDHEDSGDPRYALQQGWVSRLLVVEVGPQGSHEFVRWAADQPWEVAGHVCERVDCCGDCDGQRHDLVEVDVVIEGYDMAERSGPERRQRVPADGQQDEGHVELEGLGSALGNADTVSHHLERGSALVLLELVHEQGEVDSQPQSHEPYPLPVLVDEVHCLGQVSLQWASVPRWDHRSRQARWRPLELLGRLRAHHAPEQSLQLPNLHCLEHSTVGGKQRNPFIPIGQKANVVSPRAQPRCSRGRPGRALP